MNPFDEARIRLTRRQFLGRAATGVGSAAFATMLASTASAAGFRLPGEAKAKRVIFLYMAGGPSQLETFDHKPDLQMLDGQPMPPSVTQGQPIAQLRGQQLRCLAPQFPFKRWGESGQEVTELFPHIGGIADDICIVRSMQTEQINHDPANTFMNTGTAISGRPSMGSWVLYGLGSEAENLPGFVVLNSTGGRAQPLSTRQWHSGFLPSEYQGVAFQGKGDPVQYVGRPDGVSMGQQRDVVDAINELNALQRETIDDPEIATRIGQYEMAFRMQSSVPDLMDWSEEPAHIRELYGVEEADGSFASNCLLARRLAERGVRFVQLYHRGWDHHVSVRDGMERKAAEVDQASAALVADLKQRGMLEDTLVVWGGEFGRTPMAQGTGRDHHIRGYSIWMAGGGVRPGLTYGATDDLGYFAVENPVHVHDFHATMLYLLGVDHKKLTYRFQGRDFRLTDVHGNIVHDILA